MKIGSEKPDELINILSIISITAVALLLILLFRFKGGILGMALGTVAVASLIYWLKEMREILREEKVPSQEEDDWFYDLINEGETVTLIAKVPGPAEEVKVRLVNHILEIKGGGTFIRRVNVPEGSQLQSKSYINRVLYVKLQRVKTPNSKLPSK